MALTRARKVLELVIRDVYERRYQEPPGTRPLENLHPRLVKDGHFPDRLDAYATTIRKLGQRRHAHLRRADQGRRRPPVAHPTDADPEWYFEVERPDAAGPEPRPGRRPARTRRPLPRRRQPPPGWRSFPRGCGRSTPTTPTFSSISCPALGTRTVCPRAFASGNTGSRTDRRVDLHGGRDLRASAAAASRRWSRPGCCHAGRPCRLRLRRGDRRRHRSPPSQGAAETLSRPAGRPGPGRHRRRLATRDRAGPGPEGGHRPGPVRAVAPCRQGRREHRTRPGPAAVRRGARPVPRPGAGRFLGRPESLHGRPAHRAGPGTEHAPWWTCST